MNPTRELLPDKLATFVDELEARCRTRQKPRFFSMGDAFNDLLNDRKCWAEFFNNLLMSFLQEPFENADIQFRRIVLHTTPSCSVSLSTGALDLGGSAVVVNEGTQLVSNTGAHVMLGLLHDAPIRMNRYRMPEGSSFDVFDRSVRVCRTSTEMVRPGERIDIDGDNEVVHLEEGEKDAVSLLVTSWRTTSQIWSFTPESVIPLGASMTSELSSELVVMLEEIRRVRYLPAIGQVRDLFEHEDHHVRWGAVKCMGDLDETAAIALLERAKFDKHPHVRNAALAHLAKLTHEVESC